jgi:hypothetical protein
VRVAEMGLRRVLGRGEWLRGRGRGWELRKVEEKGGLRVFTVTDSMVCCYLPYLMTDVGFFLFSGRLSAVD